MRLISVAAMTLAVLAAEGASSAPAPGSVADVRAACRTVGGEARDGWRIDAREWVDAVPDAPAHCLVRVTLGYRAAPLEALSFGTGIELRLPAAWNGRLLFQGGGGLNGVLNPAFGRIAERPSALARGFAVVSTDGGHRGRNAVDARFAVDQQARLDFAYQSVDRTTQEAKSLIRQAYGRSPDRSYFMGCSTGGREGMLAAQRLPLAFDGVVAGNPSYDLTRIALNQAYSLQTVLRIAPKDANGEPQPSAAFTDAQLRAVADAVLARCDAIDGLADGIVHDAQACRFDPASVVCGTRAAPGPSQCLSKPQADALRAIFAGAKNSRGESLYGAFPFDTGVASPAWRNMHLGAPGAQPANAVLGRDTLRMFAMTPPRPEFDIRTFDFDRDVASLGETASINDAVATLLGTFAEHGGKLILYQGLSDQAIAPGSLIRWYERVTPRTGEGPQAWARLFTVPGMLHCAGGQATDQFDMLDAIQAWVEEGKAPDRIVARGKAFPGRTRPLCPYPRVARYESGDPEDERSFACR